jgi:DNA topoisomerase-1
VRSVTGLAVSAKDFRTWHGTVLGSVALAWEHLGHPRGQAWSERALNRAVRRAVVAVAENLGNTPAVCRGSYINPRTIEFFRSGVTIERTIAAMTGTGSAATRTPDAAETAARVAELGAAPRVERAVLKMLKE